LRPTKVVPLIVKVTVSTSPAGVLGLSDAAREMSSTRLSGKIEM